ncbi:TraB/GumN family protein [Variovorax sp. J22R133]|uniref:TraB/GumN family protein n=1 Tax=Variovorax brevis TaxID=3053503 RepID=UPI00257810A8|nr:TraB/GumN family protein [Variovorax sp. J22R133]MDM0110663.1 TraB/GumN family protein [Variovorax sp. J22R133]
MLKTLLKIALLVIGLQTCLQAVAQTPPPSNSPPEGIFFKAAKDGQTIFLFGTLHVGKPDFFPLAPNVQRALRNARQLQVEVDVLNPQLGEIYMARGLQEKRVPLSGSQAAWVDAALKRSAVDSSIVERLKPPLLAAFLVVSESSKLGLSPANSGEAFLLGFAKAARMPVVELEGIDKQMDALLEAPEAIQLLEMEETITDLQSGKALASMNGLVEGWKTGNLDLIRELALQGSVGETGKFSDAQMIRRNHLLVEQILLNSRSRPTSFVAVGVLHFVGKQNILQLLKAQGYAVQRLRATADAAPTTVE